MNCRKKTGGLNCYCFYKQIVNVIYMNQYKIFVHTSLFLISVCESTEILGGCSVDIWRIQNMHSSEQQLYLVSASAVSRLLGWSPCFTIRRRAAPGPRTLHRHQSRQECRRGDNPSICSALLSVCLSTIYINCELWHSVKQRFVMFQKTRTEMILAVAAEGRARGVTL